MRLHTPVAAAPQGRVLSPRDTTRFQTPDGRRIYVDYGRPSMRGRKIMGGLVPYGRVWRTGANAATTLVTDVDLSIAGHAVPRGTYTLYTLPTARGWTLIVNRQTGQWGTEYDGARNLGTAPMATETRAAPVERFTISVVSADARHGTLALEWGPFRWTAPIVVLEPGSRGPGSGP